MPVVDFKKCSLIIPTTFTLAAYVVTLDNSLFSMSFATPKILNCLLAVVTLAVFESISTLDTKFGEAPAAYTISVFNPISAIARVPSACTSNLSYGSSDTNPTISVAALDAAK
jgi:hypothetical protein